LADEIPEKAQKFVQGRQSIGIRHFEVETGKICEICGKKVQDGVINKAQQVIFIRRVLGNEPILLRASTDQKM